MSWCANTFLNVYANNYIFYQLYFIKSYLEHNRLYGLLSKFQGLVECQCNLKKHNAMLLIVYNTQNMHISLLYNVPLLIVPILYKMTAASYFFYNLYCYYN